jgi:hypothetical protein
MLALSREIEKELGEGSEKCETSVEKLALARNNSEVVRLNAW